MNLNIVIFDRKHEQLISILVISSKRASPKSTEPQITEIYHTESQDRITEEKKGAISLLVKVVILLILAMGNFTGFQKSDDFYIHPRLGQIKRIQKEDGPQLIEHKVIVDSQETVISWLNIMSRLENQSLSSFLFLPKGHYHQKIGYCGGHYEVFLLYNDFMFCLKDEIINRRVIKRHFPESLLWQMLFKLTKASESLSKFKLKIGNVRTQNILVNEQGQFRIVSQLSWPNTQSINFSQTELKQKLYSPQELQKFRKVILRRPKSLNLDKRATSVKQNGAEDNTLLTQELQEEQQINNEQIFSMGATLLQICTLEDSKQLYKSVKKNKEKDKQQNSQVIIDEMQIQRRLRLAQGKYSKSLVSIIAQMLKINPEERVIASDVVNLLAQHENAIMRHESFVLLKHQNDQSGSFPNNTVNHNLFTEGKNNQQIAKNREDKWGNLTMFFPFLRDMYEGKKLKKGNKPNSSSSHTGLNKHFSLTKAH